MLFGVILAGGASTRMGQPKALLRIGSGNDIFVSRLASVLADGGADEVIVVIGGHAEDIRREIASRGLPVRVVDNPNYERGQLSSLWTVLDAIADASADAIITVPVDMPLVALATIEALVAAWRERRPPVVRPVSGGRHGHPVVFDRAVFDELRSADLSVGARAVVAAHASDVLDVPVADPGAFIDIDTPEDYEKYVVGSR